jgi:hypothetical protein
MNRGLASLVGLLVAAPVGADVVINEIMYNTAGAPDVEYVELYNSGPAPQDLSGWYLLDDNDGHDRCMLVGTLSPGQYLVIAGRFDLFNANYPGVTNVNPNPFDSTQADVGFGLGNTGDQVRVFNGFDALIDIVAYADSDPWPSDADGSGPSLELINPELDNSLPLSWGAGAFAGTPGVESSLFTSDSAPLINEVRRIPSLPKNTHSVIVTAEATDDQTLQTVALWIDTGGGYSPTVMLDDGLSGDGAAGDSIFGAMIAPEPSGTLVRYYVEATDSILQSTKQPPGAPVEYLAYTVNYEPPRLRINEILAANQNGITDGAGDTDDWLEIRNAGIAPVFLDGMYLSNDFLDPQRWPLPAAVLDPGEWMLIWCDNEEVEGPYHTNFSLAREGGQIGLFDGVDHGNVMVHGFTFGPTAPDVSFGYYPDDSDTPEYLAIPTSAASNDTSTVFSGVCINEFLTSSQIGGVPDWVELYNRSEFVVDISGWHLSDDADNPARYTFPAGTILDPGDHLSVDDADLGFSLAADGSESLLLSRQSGGIGQDYVDFGPQFADVSLGRYPDGTANWHLFGVWTRDLANSCDVGADPLPPVSQLLFASPDIMFWAEIEDAHVYDVIVGDLMELHGSGGVFSAAVSGCEENNVDRAEVWVDSELPPDGALFYLVRGANIACRYGSYDSGAASQSDPRDPGVEAATQSCP